MTYKIASVLLIAAALIAPRPVLSQSPGEDVDLKRIQQKAVRELVQKENLKSAADFQHIATACYLAEDSATYQTNLETYVVKADILQVWEKYINITPRKAWGGRTVRFGFLFSKPMNRFIYPENANDPIRVGNVIYVNLCLLHGIKNMGVAFEITRLDEADKTICFCYLKDGISNGTQEIHFSKMADGGTKISHVTHYHSHSAFRDKNLYPLFHAKFVGEFHENILHQIQTGM